MSAEIVITELKDINERNVTYYYACNEITINKENAGIVEFDIDLFEGDKDQEFLSNFIGEQLINGKVRIIKPCKSKYELIDCDDLVAVAAVNDIITRFYLKGEIPSSTLYMSNEIIVKLLEHEDTTDIFMKILNLSSEDLDDFLLKLKDEMKEQL